MSYPGKISENLSEEFFCWEFCIYLRIFDWTRYLL